MTGRLTAENRNELEDILNFQKSLFRGATKILLVITLLSILPSVIVGKLHLLFSVGVSFIFFAIVLWIYLYKPILNIKKDLEAGFKKKETLFAKKVLKKKSKEYVLLDNGLKINFSDFETYKININDLILKTKFLLLWSILPMINI